MRKKRAASLMSLPANKRRVKLAKDVLKHLRGIVTATKGTYFLVNGISVNYRGQADEVVKENGCKVCALGALFVADVMIRDNMTVANASSGGGSIIKNRLKRHFGSEQLTLIESAFEVMKMESEGRAGKLLKINNAIKFGFRYKSPKGRMTAIMNNIIENKGEFIP